MKKIIGLFSVVIAAAALVPPLSAANTYIQSTSTDWEAVSGLRLKEYKFTFSDTKAAGAVGWELYFLDGFPCYGYAQYVRTWVSAKSKDGSLRANCVGRPAEIQLAYRTAKKDTAQGRTTGILKCRVDGNFSISLDNCASESWADWAKE